MVAITASFVLLPFFTPLFRQCIYSLDYKELLRYPNTNRIYIFGISVKKMLKTIRGNETFTKALSYIFSYQLLKSTVQK